LVYTSSTSVYPQDNGARVDESAPISPRDERAAILIESEALLHVGGAPSPRTKAGGESTLLRLAGIYGPSRTHLVEQVRLGEVSGQPGNHLNLIHRDDVCSAIWAAFALNPALSPRGDAARGDDAATDLEFPSGVRIFNVVDDAPATKAEVVQWLAERMGVSPPRFTGQPAAGRRGVTPDRIILNSRLKQQLGWTPQFPTFREGYAKFLSR
jgi:nucleoside-diphosphate-sugar epimerase